MYPVIYGVALAGMIFGTVTDLKTREVPDWLNYALLASGLGISLIISIATLSWQPIIYSVVGLAASYLLAHLMFYTGQWGGGDSKMIIGLGALFGLNLAVFPKIPFIIGFWVNTLFVGAAYGLVWSIVLAIIKRKLFKKEFLSRLGKIRWINNSVLGVSVILLLVGFLVHDLLVKFLSISFGVMIPLFFYLWLFVKSIESSCMIRNIPPEKLTEGDWIVEDVIVDKKYVTGPKDLGISKEQIQKLINYRKKGKIKLVKIKEGIPFVPSFLIAFLVSVSIGDVLTILLRLVG